MTDIFISHVEEDEAESLELAAMLEEHRYHVWYYERDSLLERLRERHISYLTTLTAHDQSRLGRYLRRYGFREARAYDWHELFLEQVSSGRSEPSKKTDNG